jgi:hypothetical protein
VGGAKNETGYARKLEHIIPRTERATRRLEIEEDDGMVVVVVVVVRIALEMVIPVVGDERSSEHSLGRNRESANENSSSVNTPMSRRELDERETSDE